MIRKELTIEQFNRLKDCRARANFYSAFTNGYKLVRRNKRWTLVASMSAYGIIQLLYRNSDVELINS